MASCELYHSSAYSDDLRWRMVWLCDGLGYTYTRALKVLELTDQRFLFHTTGSVCKKKYPKEKAFRKLSTPAQLLILSLVVNKPGIYLHEIQEDLHNMLLFDVDLSTICRFIHNSGFTHQNLCLVAKQRDEFICQKYIIDVSLYASEMFVFLYEIGAD